MFNLTAENTWHGRKVHKNFSVCVTFFFFY